MKNKDLESLSITANKKDNKKKKDKKKQAKATKQLTKLTKKLTKAIGQLAEITTTLANTVEKLNARVAA